MTDDAVTIAVVSTLVTAGLGAVVAHWNYTRRKTTQHLQELANQLQLKFMPPAGWLKMPTVVGTLRGRTMQLFNFSTGFGRSKRNWSAVSALPAGDGRMTLSIRRNALTTRLNHIFGPKRVTTGDSEFDEAWYVQTNQSEFVSAALIQEIRTRFMEARRAGAKGYFELQQGLVKYVESGYFTSPKCVARFGVAANLVCDLADIADVAVSHKP
jgi:hypothetical protein